MKTIDFKTNSPKNDPILALGAESAGNFSVLASGKIFLSGDFGDLLEEKNFRIFKKGVLEFLQKNKITPKAVLTDLHPLYKTTTWGVKLAQKFKAKHIGIQHHLAHVFSAIGENVFSASPHLGAEPSSPTEDSIFTRKKPSIGIACDGTGYGLDGKIWGGEVFKLSAANYQLSAERVGHLENHVMIGGDLAIREPARMIIAVLSKFMDKNEVYDFVKKYYTRNQFELLYNQMKQDFNCQETSSAGRVLDAVSVMLGFSGNERKYKHAPIVSLEQNSTLAYGNLKPKISSLYNEELKIINYELSTTHLFEYLIKNLHRDKKRLAATAQLYLAEGLCKIVRLAASDKNPTVFFSGGMANNKIMSAYMKSKGAVMNEKIPRGDGGLSFGQIARYLLTNPGD